MIVDVHTHTPQYKDAVPEDEVIINTVWRPDRPVQATVTWADYLEAQGPADRSIVFGIAWHPGELAASLVGERSGDRSWHGGLPDGEAGNVNDATATFVQAHPERLIGFMSVHPYDAHCMDEFERCRTDLGLQGVKLGANYQNFDPMESRALAIYERAQKHGLPLMLHQGTSPVRNAPIRFSHPLLIDEVAMRYPDLKIIMAHMGHPWQVESCVVIRKHPNVYADLSANFYRPFSCWEQLVKAQEWNVMDKILFGTDFPVTTVPETIDALRNINHVVAGTGLPRVSEDKVEEVIHRDALTLLELE